MAGAGAGRAEAQGELSGEETTIADTDEPGRKRGEAARKAATERSPEARRESALKAAASRDREAHREAVRQALAARSTEARREAARKAVASRDREAHREAEQAGAGGEHRPDVGTHAEPERWRVVNVVDTDVVPTPLTFDTLDQALAYVARTPGTLRVVEVTDEGERMPVSATTP